MDEITRNIATIREKIAKAARSAGRDPATVKLMAVTKAVAPAKIATAIAAGVDIIGENYIQEAQGKAAILAAAEALHFIGHLQTNKAKYAVRMFGVIQSVDRIELAREIDKRARGIGKIQDIMLEVNLGGEQSKSGVAVDGAEDLLVAISHLGHLRVRGLMSIPPPADETTALKYFNVLRDLSLRLRLLKIANAPCGELSMGMSEDYEMAVAAGATIVRIGRGIFGARGG